MPEWFCTDKKNSSLESNVSLDFQISCCLYYLQRFLKRKVFASSRILFVATKLNLFLQLGGQPYYVDIICRSIGQSIAFIFTGLCKTPIMCSGSSDFSVFSLVSRPSMPPNLCILKGDNSLYRVNDIKKDAFF